MGYTQKIGAMRHGLCLSVLACSTIVMLLVTPAAQAQSAAASDWVGKAVVPRWSGFRLEDSQQLTEIFSGPRCYLVTQVKGDALLLTAPGITGWARRDQVVPLEQADAFFANQVRAHPAEWFNHAMRAIIALEQTGDTKTAVRELDEVERLASRDPNVQRTGAQGPETKIDALFLRASIWAERKDYAKAISDLTRAIQLQPGNAELLGCRGQMWMQAKAYDKAIADYSRAIQIAPANSEAYCVRGFARKAARQFDQAIADYSEALRLNPGDSEAYCGRGWAWREKQEFARSLADFGEALRIHPRDACALDGRAWIYATCADATYRDGKKAVDIAIEACEVTRWKEAYCLETLAAAYAEAGDFASAVKWQARAIEIEPDPNEKVEYRARLRLFGEKKPIREGKP